jgi:single-strand DNA-binding protein
MNKAILLGRLTRDPELRYTSANNIPVCSFTLAVNRRFSRQGEERQADFIPIVAWSKLAEFCAKYFQKGQQVSIVGRIQVRSWDDNEGKRRYTTEVIAEEAYFADSKRDSNVSSKPQDDIDSSQEDGFYTLDDDELPF